MSERREPKVSPVKGDPWPTRSTQSHDHPADRPPVSGEPRTEDEKILDVIRSIWRFIRERL